MKTFAAKSFLLFCGLLLLASPRLQAAHDDATPHAARWYRGNLHTHSLWSDGDDYPEMIVAWYKEHGYNFLALSDHNRMLEGERWINTKTNGEGEVALEKYEAKFGTKWVERKEQGDATMVRLKTLEQF